MSANGSSTCICCRVASTSFAAIRRGIGRLVAWLASRERPLVVVEATGGLERALVAALGRAGIAAAVVNPRQIRDFARAAGLLAKTDRLDARAGAVRRAHAAGAAPARSAADPLLAAWSCAAASWWCCATPSAAAPARGEPARRGLDRGHLGWLSGDRRARGGDRAARLEAAPRAASAPRCCSPCRASAR